MSLSIRVGRGKGLPPSRAISADYGDIRPQSKSLAAHPAAEDVAPMTERMDLSQGVALQARMLSLRRMRETRVFVEKTITSAVKQKVAFQNEVPVIKAYLGSRSRQAVVNQVMGVVKPTWRGRIFNPENPKAILVPLNRWPSGLRGLLARRPLKALIQSRRRRGPREVEATKAQLLKTFTSPSFKAAQAAVQRLEDIPLSQQGRDVVERVASYVEGREPREITWGRDPRVDALRLRVLRSSRHSDEEDRKALAAVEWNEFLSWAGERHESLLQTAIPKRIRSIILAAIAARYGYRRAKEICTGMVGGDSRFEKIRRAVAMRCAISGHVDWDVAKLLLPVPSRRKSSSSRSMEWSCALIALRACHDGDNTGGALLLTAAIMSHIYRERIPAQSGLITERGTPHQPSLFDNIKPGKRYVQSSSDCEETEGSRQWTRDLRAPCSGGMRGPDPRRILATLRRRLSVDEMALRTIIIHPQLVLAGIYACLGNGAGARGALASTPGSSATEGVRKAIRESLTSSTKGKAVLEDFLKLKRWEEEANNIYGMLRDNEDPSMLLGSPYWMVWENLGTMQGRLGLQQVCALRRLRQRKDISKWLGAYLLLDQADQALVYEAACWMARQVEHPVSLDWPGLLEKLCFDSLVVVA